MVFGKYQIVAHNKKMDLNITLSKEAHAYIINVIPIMGFALCK